MNDSKWHSFACLDVVGGGDGVKSRVAPLHFYG